MSLKRPDSNQYGAYYKNYIDLVEGDPIQYLRKQKENFPDFIKNNIDRLDFSYQEGKWTLKELMIHIIETEVIFANRALRISRGDQVELPGFDQDNYIKHNNYDHITPDQLISLFDSNRRMLLSLYDTFTPEQYEKTGTASGYPLSVGAVAFILAGHYIHHFNIIRERYL